MVIYFEKLHDIHNLTIDNEEDSDEFQNTDSDKSKNKHSSTDSN